MPKWPANIGQSVRRYWFILPLALLLSKLRDRQRPPDQPPVPPNEPPYEPPVPPKRRPIAYFSSDDVTLMLRHQGDLSNNDDLLLSALRDNPIIRSDDRLIRALDLNPRIQWFPPVNDRQPFSLATLRIEGADERELVDLINRIDKQIAGGDSQGSQAQISAITANWVVSSASHQWTVGGPGAKPVPASVPETQPSGGRAPWTFDLFGEIETNERRGEDVTVAILDTAPSTWDLAYAYEHWSGRNPLLAELLDPKGSFQIEYMPYQQAVGVHDWPLANHLYNMSDHGLFAAGVIHSIAPGARIRLIEVLGPSGAGTVESLIWGLKQLIPIAQQGKLVINCSLMTSLPSDPRLLEQLAAKTPIGHFDPETLRRQMSTLDEVCQTLHSLGVCLIAAAGNDGKDKSIIRPGDDPHPDPRYPAALPVVHGIGALDRQGQPTDYSNEAEPGSEVGIAVFGGVARIVGSDHRADPNDGMLGLYIGTFPAGGGMPEQRSANGWGRWAGTSFAAPVISGAIAVLRSRGLDCDAAFKELERQAGGDTGVGRVLRVSQG